MALKLVRKVSPRERFGSHWDMLFVQSLSCVRLFAIPCTVACQTPLSMGFSKQEYWSGLPCPSPGDLPDPGIEPGSAVLQADSLLSEPPGKPLLWDKGTKYVPCQFEHQNDAQILKARSWVEFLHHDFCSPILHAQAAAPHPATPCPWWESENQQYWQGPWTSCKPRETGRPRCSQGPGTKAKCPWPSDGISCP